MIRSLSKSEWGNDTKSQNCMFNIRINELKKKLDPLKSKSYIKTLRGVGYMVC